MSKVSKCRDCSKIEELYSQITSLTNLQPSKEVNSLFSELVSLAISDSKKHLLSPKKQSHLRQICALSEFELEKYWAKRIIDDTNPKQMLLNFPYYKNYQDLTKLEYFSIRGCSNHEVHHYLFVGGGPLPMTAIILALEYGAMVTILDYDSEACQMSRKMISGLGLDRQINIIYQDGSTYKDYNKFEVIFVAALAGIDKNVKLRILKQISEYSRKNTHVLARSAWGNRKILYRPVDKEIYKLFTPVVEVHPQNHIVNSVVVMKT